MKKTIIAAVAALFIGFGANAQSVNDNQANATVADVVAELSQARTATTRRLPRLRISRRFTPICSARSWYQSRTRLL